MLKIVALPPSTLTILYGSEGNTRLVIGFWTFMLIAISKVVINVSSCFIFLCF